MTARTTFPTLGTTAVVVVTEPDRLAVAEDAVRRTVAEIDATCSRFRADSEITRLHAQAGTAAPLSDLLARALRAALRAAEVTDGIVDPTVGDAVRDLGYDRDFAAVDRDGERPAPRPRPAPGWWRVRLDPSEHWVLLPRGVALDLGATAKALASDLAAARAATATGCGVLVSLGGDLAVAGPAPAGGWRIAIGDDHETAEDDPATTVTVRTGGLATSSTTRRTWRRAGRTLHHIVDPRTGDVPEPVWRTVSVTATSCVDANTASTASIVLGAAAVDWLAARRLPARLVAVDGAVTTVAGWPDDELGRAA